MQTRRSTQPTRQKPSGFALIITISLMVLLTLVAVGLLSLSGVALRSSSQSEAMATAKANARMALVISIGELQKFAGPDRRVTARADVIGANVANPRIAGVWESWEIDPKNPPQPSDYEDSARNERFLGWLTSGGDPADTSEVDYVSSAPNDPALLWGEGSLGDNAAAEDLVRAARVPTEDGSGAFAYAVMDEGVKVRINTPHRDPTGPLASHSMQLGAGQRPNTASIESLGSLERDFFESSSSSFSTIEKGFSRQSMAMAVDQLASGTGEALKPLSHDITTSSVGLFTNVAQGGLKEDFNLLTNGDDLPSPYDGTRGIYDTLLDMQAAEAPSDPRWESFRQLAGLYRDADRLTSSGGIPVAKARIPSTWRAASNSSATTGDRGELDRDPPPGMILMPTIAKVQVVFSLLTRDIYRYTKVSDTTPKPPGTKAQEEAAQIHGPWGKRFAGSDYDYLLHLMYTPVVTLHNPYNVALEFNDLKVMFGNVPFGLQVFRNGVAQTTAPAPLDKMFYQNSEKGLVHKRFGMTLRTNGGSTSRPAVGSTTFRMLPGEVIMFSPYIDPNSSWNDKEDFADWRSGSAMTVDVDGIPGWRGDGIGFDLDWFAPADIRASQYEREGRRAMDRGGCIGVKADDEFMVQFAPLSVPNLSDNKFTIELFGRTSGRRQVSSGAIEMNYSSPTGLQDTLLGPGGTITYPKEGTINAMAMHSHASTPIKDIATVKPFAVVSAHAKTTLGGLNPDGEDGDLATKPWCFGHANIGAFSGNLVAEHPANHSHEFSIQRLDNGTNNLLQFDPATGRGNFISGLTGNTGAKFGIQYELPLAPLQALPALNAANPGGSSGYLPRFSSPIGNSWAHPLVNTNEVSTNGGDYPYLDHSFLLNTALYDRFYFSGLGDRTGPFGSGQTASSLAQSFIDGEPLADPRLSPYTPREAADTDFVADVVGDDTAHRQIAAWQVMNGAFNINSTSVQAWKAMLGSIHDAEAIYNQINKAGKTASLADLPASNTAQNEARISRFRLPASESADDGADPIDAYWLGPREYSEDQLERLAEEIVEQVRKRGPFLSMSEFVNRRLGSDTMAQKGALQEAIDEAGLNADLAAAANAGFDIPQAKVADYRYANPEAGAGASYQGAPGYLSQADLLTVLGNAATPRSDTFTIRAYGEARDSANRVVASAVCEATVQRVPDYLDASDSVDADPDSLNAEANKRFGRRFEISSFRWLSSNEV
ncbi:hypothetical protein JIN81_00990 [Haloferula rosea]|uniref:Verru_Chthon cassette protein A n=2 Tax=Haloferula rosea TaxID=490093 RepID=A0A934RA28_9BACT|nr:hypothetical protein [Haloferula rosea]